MATARRRLHEHFNFLKFLSRRIHVASFSHDSYVVISVNRIRTGSIDSDTYNISRNIIISSHLINSFMSIVRREQAFYERSARIFEVRSRTFGWSNGRGDQKLSVGRRRNLVGCLERKLHEKLLLGYLFVLFCFLIPTLFSIKITYIFGKCVSKNGLT